MKVEPCGVEWQGWQSRDEKQVRYIQCVYSTAKGTTKKSSWKVSNLLRCPTGVIYIVMWHNGYLSGRSNVCGVLRISEVILCTRTTVFWLAVCVCLHNNLGKSTKGQYHFLVHYICLLSDVLSFEHWSDWAQVEGSSEERKDERKFQTIKRFRKLNAERYW